ncbi:D-alanine-D-alanine ligase [Myxococcaceae bacterium]|jgi:D-alanine-D-alanine ligase|nr:D-alanine-D-alanine ligase [Myxococcaceae bacterium]
MAGELILLFGGPTRERRVSVASAQTVVRELDAPRCWFWAPDGAVHELAVGELLAHERPFETDLVPSESARFEDLKQALDALSGRELFFLGLHGGVAEDGTLQGWLEARRLAFTGSGSRASREAFDKNRAREIARSRGLRIAEAITLDPSEADTARGGLERLLERHRRIVLKPVADGSSMGLRFLSADDDAADLIEAIESIRKEAIVYLAEAFIEGTELTAGVIDEERGLRALPVSEVRLVEAAGFDYAAKYLGRGVREITPAEVAPEITAEAQRMALVAHEMLGCFGYSRTDLIVDEAGPVYLETNTLPGLTRASFIPQQLAAAGIELRSFIDRQLALARRRQSRATLEPAYSAAGSSCS